MEHKLVSVCKCCVDSAPIKCPVCSEGNIKKIDFIQNMSVFYGCSNHPFCTHTYKACPICKKALSRIMPRQNKYFCIDEDCSGSVDKCKTNEGYLRRITGPEGPFWGCTDYKDTNCNSSKAYTDENAEECPKCINSKCNTCEQSNKYGKIVKKWSTQQNRPLWGCTHDPSCKWIESYGNLG